MVNLLIMGVVAGVVGTLVMDSMNHVFFRLGVLQKIDIAIIGRMSAGWAQGRFVYHHPDDMQTTVHERVLGWFTHYAISVVFALLYVLGWYFLADGPVSAFGALIYGVATTMASQFLVFPSLGFGVFGRRSPEGIKAPLSSLANHLFFGLGMAIVIALW